MIEEFCMFNFISVECIIFTLLFDNLILNIIYNLYEG